MRDAQCTLEVGERVSLVHATSHKVFAEATVKNVDRDDVPGYAHVTFDGWQFA